MSKQKQDSKERFIMRMEDIVIVPPEEAARVNTMSRDERATWSREQRRKLAEANQKESPTP